VLFHSIEWRRLRRRLEAAKRAADLRIREQAALIDKAHDAILVKDLRGQVLYANPSAERLYGWSFNELQAGHATHGLADQDPAMMEARRLASKLANGSSAARFRRPDGFSYALDTAYDSLPGTEGNDDREL
jgi:PAS domain S-box-containing protein